MSQSGVIAVLKSIREHGMPKHVSRSTLKRTRERELDSDTAYGPLFVYIEMEAKQGGKKKVPVVAPLPLLANSVEAAPFALFLDSLMSEKAPMVSNKWRICLYCDEVLPGNALKPTNERKLVAFYWSFMEYGKYLYNDQLWMHICSIRASHIKTIDGGYSAVFKNVAGLFFREPYDLRLGVQLRLPAAGTSRFLFAEIGGVVSDEAALKQMWSCKGSSGSLPCFLCQNVVAHSSSLDLHDSTGTLVPSCTTNYSQCIPNRSQAVLEKARLLSTQNPLLSNADFKTLEQTVGLTFNPQGALWDATFQTYLKQGCVEVTGFDFMHVLFVGCWNTEVGYLLGAITRVVKPSDLHAFLQTIRGSTWLLRVTDGNICTGDGESPVHELHSWRSQAQGTYCSPIFSGGATESETIFTSRYTYEGLANTRFQVTDALQQTGEWCGKSSIHRGSNWLQLQFYFETDCDGVCLQERWSMASFWCSCKCQPLPRL